MAVFVNKHQSILKLFWWDEEEEEELPVKGDLAPGETWSTATFNGHVFVAYDESTSMRREFTVEADFGETDEFHIDWLDEF
jgi:hypothetical protein